MFGGAGAGGGNGGVPMCLRFEEEEKTTRAPSDQPNSASKVRTQY